MSGLFYVVVVVIASSCVTSKIRRRCIAKYRRRYCAVRCSVGFISVGVSLSCQCRCVISLGVYELAENKMLLISLSLSVFAVDGVSTLVLIVGTRFCNLSSCLVVVCYELWFSYFSRGDDDFVLT